MLRLFSINIILIPAFILNSALCLASSGTQPVEEKKLKGPIIITSATLSADNKARTALFKGTVVAKAKEITLYSDEMLVHYAEGTGNIQQIEATGNVKLLKNDLLITSAKASYFAEEEKVVFDGEPKAVTKNNVVTGSKITYFLKEDRSIVENSKVLLENKKEK